MSDIDCEEGRERRAETVNQRINLIKRRAMYDCICNCLLDCNP